MKNNKDVKDSDRGDAQKPGCGKLRGQDEGEKTKNKLSVVKLV